MALSLGFDNVKVDKTGRVSVAGSRTGLDWHTLVDKMVEAKSIPIDMIDKKITAEGERLAALNNFQSKVNALKSALSPLYGEHTFDRGKDIFEKKIGVISTVGAGSPPNDLLGASAKNNAKIGQYEVMITQVARPHKIHSKIIPFGVAAAAGLAGAMVLQNPVTLADKAIVNISPSDSVLTIVDKINNSAGDLMASAVSIDSTHSKIVLLSKKTGQDCAIQFSPSSTPALMGVASGLGLATWSGAAYTIDNEVEPAKNAVFSVDGVSLVRQSNVINDVIQDVTFQLLKEEPGTKISVSIERDVGAIRSQIEQFVDAYNEILIEANIQAHQDPHSTTQMPLYNTSFIRSLKSQLANFVTVSVNEMGNVRTLKDIGIMANTGLNALKGDYRTVGHLMIDQNKMDQAIVGDVEAFRKFFVFDFRSSAPEITLSRFPRSIKPLTIVPSALMIDTDGSQIVSAFFTEGATTTTARTIEVTEGAAKGLIMAYAGTENRAAQIDYSVGVAVQMMNFIDEMLNDNSGLIAQNIKTVQSTQAASQKSKDQKQLLIEQYRQRELRKYQHMEQKVSESRSIMDNIEAMFKQDGGK
jgi:flagellar hook-associated protein 2